MMEFETLEEMIGFYEANKDKYELTYGVDARLYHKRNDGFPSQPSDLIAIVDDPRAAALALDRLKGMVGI